MSKYVKVSISGERMTGSKIMTGRLVGFIDDSECKAILNSEDAPKKISTSESIEIKSYVGETNHKRFVLVVKDPAKDELPTIFISPKIKLLTWKASASRLRCEDDKLYTFEDLVEKEVT